MEKDAYATKWFQSGFTVLATKRPVTDLAPLQFNFTAVSQNVLPRVMTSSIRITFFPLKQLGLKTKSAVGLQLFPAICPASESDVFVIAFNVA